ncbi:1-deoxy-D-xylulose-5-phosphate synthase [Variovorax sp. GB1P17]|uniref:1-deoxy-D-xylulose-5-phosphate synthase n=1 Tax=Variovorax sp. GB1P17 TaxID=3443740 RepID=UPI003F48CBB3
MYIESKAGGLTGPARIGRVTFSKSGATLYYGQKAFRSLKGIGFKSNYFDVETGDHYWISGPRKDGNDALYATHVRPVVDADVLEAYWSGIRGLAVPHQSAQQ